MSRSSRPTRIGNTSATGAAGPSDRGDSPLVFLDAEGQFHLCISSSFGEAVLEKAYGDEGYHKLRDWLRSLGIPITWDSPSQMTFPHEKLPPKELHKQIYESYRMGLALTPDVR